MPSTAPSSCCNGRPRAAKNSTTACSASPRNVETLGDCIKIGRRGSQSGTLYVEGIQGHVAYPHRASNPVPDISRLIVALSDEPLDHGSAQFQPSNLEFTSVDVGNPASNVIPGTGAGEVQHPLQRSATRRQSLRELVEARLAKAAGNRIKAHIVWEPSNSERVRDQARRLYRPCGRRQSRRSPAASRN